MVPRTVHTFTRADIQAALDTADLDILPERFSAQRIAFETATCLAFDQDTDADLLAFAHVVASLLPYESDRLDFALAARPSIHRRDTVTWPGYVLAEQSADEWDDAHNEDADRDALAGAL